MTCAGDLRELLRVPLRSQGYCGVGRGLSGLLWVWCNGRGPHLELRQEPQGSAPDFLALDLTWIAGSLLSGSGDSDLVFCGGMELRLPLKLFKDDTTFRAVCGTCMFFGDARGRQCSSMLCLHPQVCLRRGVWASGSPQVRTGKSGSFSMLHHPRGYVSNFLVRPASP